MEKMYMRTEKEILTVKEASWLVGKHDNTIRLWHMKGLKAVIDEPLSFRREDVLEFAKNVDKAGRKKKVKTDEI